MKYTLIFISFIFGVKNNLVAQEKNDLLDNFIQKKIIYNEQSKKGHSILLYNGNEEEALKIHESFKEDYQDISIKIAYESPDWKVITPSYPSKLEAEKIYLKIKKTYPNAKIM